jgi:hypothetical protein
MPSLRWSNPTYPEKGICRIRKTSNALAEIGWKIVGWASVNRPVVENRITKEFMELPATQVEVADEQNG